MPTTITCSPAPSPGAPTCCLRRPAFAQPRRPVPRHSDRHARSGGGADRRIAEGQLLRPFSFAATRATRPGRRRLLPADGKARENRLRICRRCACYIFSRNANQSAARRETMTVKPTRPLGEISAMEIQSGAPALPTRDLAKAHRLSDCPISRLLSHSLSALH